MSPLAIALVVRDSAVRSEVSTALQKSPFRVVVDCQGGQNFETVIRQLKHRRPEIVFVEVPDRSPASLQLVSRLKSIEGDHIVVAVHPSPNVDLVMAALRAGANEFLHSPMPEHLAAMLEDWQEIFNARARGRAIGFISAKGGCGATTIACHSALAIGKRQESNKRILLMDLDLSTGLARFLMKSQTEYSVLDAVRNMQRLDLSYWNALVCSKHPGLDVLSAPENLSSGERLDGSEVRDLLNWTRRYYEWIVLDFGRGLGQVATAALPEICEMYVVATHEIASLHFTKKVFRSLENAGYPLAQVRLVVNRTPATVRATIQEIEAALGAPVFVALPNDYASLSECYSSGRLLPNRGKLASGIQSLAAKITGEKVAPKQNLASRIAGRVLMRGPARDERTVLPPDAFVWQEPSGQRKVPATTLPLLDGPRVPVSPALPVPVRR